MIKLNELIMVCSEAIDYIKETGGTICAAMLKKYADQIFVSEYISLAILHTMIMKSAA